MSPDLIQNCKLARAVIDANPSAPFASELRAAMDDGLHVAMADPSTVFSSPPPANVIVVAFDTESGGPGGFDTSLAAVIANARLIVVNAGLPEARPYQIVVAGAKSVGNAVLVETIPERADEWRRYIVSRLNRKASALMFAPPLN